MDKALCFFLVLALSLRSDGAPALENFDSEKSDTIDVNPKSFFISENLKEGDEFDDTYLGTDVKQLVLEILAVVDFSDYSYFLERANGNSEEAVKDIKLFYANVFELTNRMYQTINTTKYRYTIKIADLIILKTSDESQFTENESVNGNVNEGIQGSEYVKGIRFQTALDQFKDYVNKLDNFDIAVAFTRYGSVESSGILGKAYLKSACTRSAVAVVKHTHVTSTAKTLAHEIGHILGSPHDSVDNPCLQEEFYIMSPGQHYQTNSDKFSRCSKAYFSEYISSLKCNCLAITNAEKPLDFSKELVTPFGILFDAQRQCKDRTGVNSSVCPGYDLCQTLVCYNPSGKVCNYNSGLGAFDYTSCGHKQWCMKGKCVHDEQAPEFPDSCIFGDTPTRFSVNGNDYSCPELVNIPHFCQSEGIRKLCCATCKQLERKE